MEQAERNLFAAVRINDKIDRMYTKMLYRNRDSVLTYAMYAYWVQRKCELSNSLVKEYLFYAKEKGLAPNSCNIMLHISMESDSVGSVLNCSANVSGKLGFSKREIAREHLNTLIPPFYREHHVASIKRMIGDMSEECRLFNFHKRTLCMNNYNELIEFEGKFRILPVQDNLSMIGYIQLKERKSRDYWIVVHKGTGRVLESYPPLARQRTEALMLKDIVLGARTTEDLFESLLSKEFINISYSMETVNLELPFVLFLEVPYGD